MKIRVTATQFFNFEVDDKFSALEHTNLSSLSEPEFNALFDELAEIIEAKTGLPMVYKLTCSADLEKPFLTDIVNPDTRGQIAEW